ncbi:phosphoribosylanthranilate isomerase [Saccharibacillus sacchari]|uniref:phosphoribosylanthranilate isomerase n=1 Tax=Saccharibacillus sacchari TaxID=456493 RepID=UPI0004B61104|nr:phosphoribosylanthranilate isomerase [Saccharibacillus sacchari]
MTDQENKRPQIKICGIRTPEALKKAAELQVDYIGLVFAPSKRQVNMQQAAELIQELHAWHESFEAQADTTFRPRVAGVFVNPTLEELQQILSNVRLDVIQLHGQESPELCKQARDRFGIPVFKAVPIGGDDREESHSERAERIAADYAGTVDVLLIDTHDPLYGGGSGRTFNWEIIPLYRSAARRNGLQLFVAGGLAPENVQQLIADYKPDGIDVSSGVETDGHKDLEKMTTFVERAV